MSVCTRVVPFATLCSFCILKLVFVYSSNAEEITHPPCVSMTLNGKGIRYVTSFKTGMATGFKVNLFFILVAGIKQHVQEYSTLLTLSSNGALWNMNKHGEKGSYSKMQMSILV